MSVATPAVQGRKLVILIRRSFTQQRLPAIQNYLEFCEAQNTGRSVGGSKHLVAPHDAVRVCPQRDDMEARVRRAEEARERRRAALREQVQSEQGSEARVSTAELP